MRYIGIYLRPFRLQKLIVVHFHDLYVMDKNPGSKIANHRVTLKCDDSIGDIYG